MTESTSLARYSCTSCRKGKRKCTKELPKCQLCQKARRPCVYMSEAPLEQSGSVRDAGPMSRRILQPLFFLDAYTHGQRHVIIENPKVPLPREFANRTSIWDSVDLYFDTYHVLFPVGGAHNVPVPTQCTNPTSIVSSVEATGPSGFECSRWLHRYCSTRPLTLHEALGAAPRRQ